MAGPKLPQSDEGEKPAEEKALLKPEQKPEEKAHIADEAGKQRVAAKKDVAEGLTETPPFVDPKWREKHEIYKQELANHPEWEGPIANLIGLALKYGAIIKGGMDKFMPWRFMENLDTNNRLIGEEFKGEDIERLHSKNLNSDVEGEKIDENAKNYAYKIEQESTRTACRVLGVDSIADPLVLAAKLRNATYPPEAETGPYMYKRESADVTQLKKLADEGGIPKGTVMIASFFDVPNITKGFSGGSKSDISFGIKRFQETAHQRVYIATGNGDEYEGYDPEDGKVKKFHLKDENDPIQAGKMSLAASFVPVPDEELLEGMRDAKAGGAEVYSDETKRAKLKELDQMITSIDSDVYNLNQYLKDGDLKNPEMMKRILELFKIINGTVTQGSGEVFGSMPEDVQNVVKKDGTYKKALESIIKVAEAIKEKFDQEEGILEQRKLERDELKQRYDYYSNLGDKNKDKEGLIEKTEKSISEADELIDQAESIPSTSKHLVEMINKHLEAL